MNGIKLYIPKLTMGFIGNKCHLIQCTQKKKLALCLILLSICVCRCGFAQSQEAYDAAVNELFSTLDNIDDHLGGSRYLCGDELTLADVCLFTTLIRFDLVYNVLFKCTKKKLIEYPNLHGYLRDIYQVIALAPMILCANSF